MSKSMTRVLEQGDWMGTYDNMLGKRYKLQSNALVRIWALGGRG